MTLAERANDGSQHIVIDSPLYRGVHWSYDKTFGRTQGRSIAQFVTANAFQPK